MDSPAGLGGQRGGGRRAADGPLEPGDVIVEAEGSRGQDPWRSFANGDGGRQEPGDSLRAAGSSATATSGPYVGKDPPTTPARAHGHPHRAQARSPVDISIDAGHVGGPSAGLAFALDIYDELGEDIDDGRQGRRHRRPRSRRDGVPIGGIKQKTYRRAQGRTPTSSSSRTRTRARRAAYAEDTRVVPVSSFRKRCHVWQVLVAATRHEDRFLRNLRKFAPGRASPERGPLVVSTAAVAKRTETTCNDCFFRRAELCAIPGNCVCPTVPGRRRAPPRHRSSPACRADPSRATRRGLASALGDGSSRMASKSASVCAHSRIARIGSTASEMLERVLLGPRAPRSRRGCRGRSDCPDSARAPPGRLDPALGSPFSMNDADGSDSHGEGWKALPTTPPTTSTVVRPPSAIAPRRTAGSPTKTSVPAGASTSSPAS